MLISLLVGVLALGVSVWAVLESRSVGQRQNKLQERLLSLESARERDRLLATRSAHLRASLEKDAQFWNLVVVNDGPSEARSIQTHVDDKPLLEHALVPQGTREVTVLGAGARAPYLMAFTMGSEAVLAVRLEWEDDSGAPGRWSSQLKL
jgi:hypothetical protein